MRRLGLIGLLLATVLPLKGYDFETLPSAVRTRGRGVAVLDGDRYKDGSHSLRFSWTGQAELLLSDPEAISAFMASRKGGVMMWICNEKPMKEPLRVSFRDAMGQDVCWFDFGMDFCGWRAAWVRYEDMHTRDGYIGDRPVKERRKDAVLMALRPSPRVAEGSFCLDRLTFSSEAIHHQNTPDAQIPDNNHFLSRRNLWHWAMLQQWDRYPALEASQNPDEASLSALEHHLDALYAKEKPSGKPLDFASLSLTRLPDGTPKGKPIVSNDEASPADLKLQPAFTLLHHLAWTYKTEGDRKALEDFFLLADHLLWQGVDKGSGMGTNHHYGYSIRGWCNSLWLLRDEIREAGKMAAYRAALAYWSGLAECRLPFDPGRDEIIDSWNTLLLPRMTAAMLQDTPGERQAEMEALTRWMEGAMSYRPGTLGGIKPDGTAFHHGGHYPAYADGAFATLSLYFSLVDGTAFVPSSEARICVKKALLAMRTYCHLYDWGIGISGRHPFGGSMPAKVRSAFGRLAVLGDLSGSGKEADPELGGAFFALKGSDKEVAERLRAAGIKAEDAPEGFFVFNYGAFGIHRRAGWMVTLKAYNSDVWGSEIYTRDNRYGRYQSYGSVQVIHSGKPASAEDSRYSEAGWDWNRLPGTTTIHLPWDRLNSPNKGTLMERNDSRFPGVSSLEGRNGVLAFTYTEKDRPHFCAGATATQSVFCFDNRLVCIGSGISNTSDCPTETTLFQQRLDSPGEGILVDGQLLSAFPLKWRGEKRAAVLEDLKGDCYILPDASSLVMYRQHQKSPDNTASKVGEGDFVTAVLDHGVSPSNASFEYLHLIEPTSSERRQWSRKRPYTVLQSDNDAHAVKDLPTGITAVVSYRGYRDASLEIPAETILMQRPEGKSLIMSICTPDLGLDEKTYTTPQESQVVERTVRLQGKWKLSVPYSDAVFGTGLECLTDGNDTVLTARCRHGHPVEFTLIAEI